MTELSLRTEVYAVNKAGIKIYPAEIDALVERNDEVVEACAFGLPDPISGDLLGVALVACDRESFCTATLRSWLARRLAREKLPDRIFVVDKIPKNQRGKVIREEIKKMVMEASVDI